MLTVQSSSFPLRTVIMFLRSPLALTMKPRLSTALFDLRFVLTSTSPLDCGTLTPSSYILGSLSVILLLPHPHILSRLKSSGLLLPCASVYRHVPCLSGYILWWVYTHFLGPKLSPVLTRVNLHCSSDVLPLSMTNSRLLSLSRPAHKLVSST